MEQFIDMIVHVHYDSTFILAFQFCRGGGPAQKIAEKMIFSTKKVAKYR